MLAEGTLYWGVSVERVEVKDVRVPEQLMRAMAAEAEAAREARAKVHANIFQIHKWVKLWARIPCYYYVIIRSLQQRENTRVAKL